MKAPITSKKPTDTEILDALQEYLWRSPLVLWNGMGDFPGSDCRIPGLACGRVHRDLRAAVASAMLNYTEDA